jgi:hypothetical protein
MPAAGASAKLIALPILEGFRATVATVDTATDGTLRLDGHGRAALGVRPGDALMVCPL